MKKNIRLAAAVALALSSASFAQQAVQWKVSEGGNGHWYQVMIVQSGISWSAAKNESESRSGMLACAETTQELSFLQSRFGPAQVPTAWVPQHPWNDFTFGPWLGAYQEPGAPEPAGGWKWLTGVPYSPPEQYFNNDACGVPEDRLHLYYSTIGKIVINDMPNAAVSGCGPANPSYLIEWSADCNNDGIVDYGQIQDGTMSDANVNGVPDCCEQGTSCSSETITSGLQLHLRFDSNCLDSSGFDRHGAPSSIQFVADRFNRAGKAAFLNGLTSDIQVLGVPIPEDNEFSWTMWARFDALGVVKLMERVQAVGINLTSPFLYGLPDGRIVFGSYAFATGGSDTITPPSQVSDGVWTHIACTSTLAGLRRVYCNGVLVAESVAPNYGHPLSLILIGRDRLDSVGRFRGALDDLRVYDRPLSPTEVIAVRDATAPQAITCRDADFFRDFNVNGADLGILLSQWGPDTPFTVSDLDADGVVDGNDLGIFLGFWGPCPN